MLVSEGKKGGDAGPIDSREGAQFDRRRGDRRAGVTRAHDRGRFAFLHQVDGATDR